METDKVVKLSDGQYLNIYSWLKPSIVRILQGWTLLLKAFSYFL